MLRITKESEYAFLLLSALLEHDGEAQSAKTLSGATGVALPMTSKVLKRLVKNNILNSTRGIHGGYALAQEAATVTAFDVVQAMEGAPELVDCVSEGFNCELAPHCRISPFWRSLNDEIATLLEEKSLADMQRMDKQRIDKKIMVLHDKRHGV